MLHVRKLPRLPAVASRRHRDSSLRARMTTTRRYYILHIDSIATQFPGRGDHKTTDLRYIVTVYARNVRGSDPHTRTQKTLAPLRAAPRGACKCAPPHAKSASATGPTRFGWPTGAVEGQAYRPCSLHPLGSLSRRRPPCPRQAQLLLDRDVEAILCERDALVACQHTLPQRGLRGSDLPISPMPRRLPLRHCIWTNRDIQMAILDRQRLCSLA